MLPEERDAALLWDMREAACEIIEMVKGMKYEEFVSTKVVRYAVERQILVIGEAAKRISATFRDTHSEIPWSSIVAQRNILAHEYGEILVERGNTVAQILTQAEAIQADLIVMGTYGQGTFKDAMMGSTVRRVLRRSRIPVLVIRLSKKG